MEDVKFEKVTRYTYRPPDQIKITTYNRKKTTSLKQFAIRKRFGEIASKTRGIKGVVRDEERLMPKSAHEMKIIEGTKAEELITTEVRKEYEKRFGKRRKG
ncbi:MAG: hypothetical protein K6T73_01090 [Candidatus Bathyarchaeota archaeon]|nr:hypothetical protein [Candidatus Bathyarchaeota archaeon]